MGTVGLSEGKSAGTLLPNPEEFYRKPTDSMVVVECIALYLRRFDF